MTDLTKDELDTLQIFLAAIEAEKYLGGSICGRFDAAKIFEDQQKAKQFDKFLEYAEKTQRIHEVRRGSEPAPFVMREGITALIPMDFKEFNEYQKLKAKQPSLTSVNDD